MKLIDLKCPTCGNLKLEASESSKDLLCPYCGHRFILDDEKREVAVDCNVDVDEKICVRVTDDAEIIKEINKGKEDKRSWIFIAAGFLGPLLILALIAGGFAINGKVAEFGGKVSAGYYRDLVGEDVKTVEAHFEAAGFTDVQLIDLDDSGIAFWKKGDVVTISVGGNTSFEPHQYFDPSTRVVISYH